jgi:protein-arginine kinase activator protein McsA
MAIKEKKSKVIKCEVCTTLPSVIIHKKVYYCADCYIFETKIPMSDAIQNLYNDGQTPKLKN